MPQLPPFYNLREQSHGLIVPFIFVKTTKIVFILKYFLFIFFQRKRQNINIY